MNVYAMTPTGARPEGLALLGEYIDRQTYSGKLNWVIVDDCEPASRIPTVREGVKVTVIRPEQKWRPGSNTQVACMRAALEQVPADAVVLILEDDDVYLPDYIDTMLSAMKNHELVGEIDSRYYNVHTSRWRILRGKFHSSMASTACRGRALALLRDLCNSSLQKMLDVNLWKSFDGSKSLLSTKNVVGIKGLPGRPGIGIGHRPNFGALDTDDILQSWIGDYSVNYSIFGRAT